MRQFVYISVIFMCSLGSVVAQKIRNASGTATFRLEEDMSRDDLKDKLRHYAVINAIEREYGTYVTQESFVDVDDGNTQFRIFGTTTIRGEWLSTTQEDFKEEMRTAKEGRRNRHELWMSLKIEGKVREISEPEPEINYFTANCKKAVCKTSFFENGEPMYVHFNSPVSGFLSVYVVENNEAYRLLPYKNMPVQYSNAVPVKADTDYVFFSPYGNNDYFEGFSTHLIDELVMTTDRDEEYVRLYLVFSTEEYLKPSLLTAGTDPDSGYEIPYSLDAATLTAWLENNRINNTHFYYRQLSLKIVK
jgi:hypothetical protein